MRIEERGDKLVIVDFDEFEAYRIACKIEKDGIKFYRKLSGSMKPGEARELVEFLVEEERKHLRFFEDCLSAAREKGEDTSEDNDLIASFDFGVFMPYRDMAELEDVLTDTPKALRLGVAIEDKSIKFYDSCREGVSAVQTREELGSIINEEKRHKDLLTKMADNLPSGSSEKPKVSRRR